jgi:hypothetical protein
VCARVREFHSLPLLASSSWSGFAFRVMACAAMMTCAAMTSLQNQKIPHDIPQECYAYNASLSRSTGLRINRKTRRNVNVHVLAWARDAGRGWIMTHAHIHGTHTWHAHIGRTLAC